MIKERYIDIINPQKKQPDKEKSGDDIVLDVLSRAGLELI